MEKKDKETESQGPFESKNTTIWETDGQQLNWYSSNVETCGPNVGEGDV